MHSIVQPRLRFGYHQSGPTGIPWLVAFVKQWSFDFGLTVSVDRLGPLNRSDVDPDGHTHFVGLDDMGGYESVSKSFTASLERSLSLLIMTHISRICNDFDDDR